jgi:RHS repeat-associated protein
MTSRASRKPAVAGVPIVFLVVFSVLSVFGATGCGCSGPSSPGFMGHGDGGVTTADIHAAIVATPPSIPRGDNFATQVTLDGSSSTGPGDLTFAWNIGSARLISGTLQDAKITVAFDGTDNAAVSLLASIASASNSANALVRIDTAPTLILTDEWTTDAGATLTIDASKSYDRENDPLTYTWTVTAGPDKGTASINPASAGKATFMAAVPGDYTIQLVLAGPRLTTNGTATVHVLPPMTAQNPLHVTVAANPPVAAKGSAVTFTITVAESLMGPTTVNLRAGGQTVTVNGMTGSMTFSATGDYPVVADVYNMGVWGRGVGTLDVYDPAIPDDGQPPQVALTTPADGSDFKATVTATGTASDADLAAYYLETRQTSAATDEPWTVIYTGTASVNGGNLGTVDRTFFHEEDYQLRLRARDTRGHEASVSNKISVDFAGLQGNMSLSFVEQLPRLSGPPLVFKRSYDSTDRAVRDYGYGWGLTSTGNGQIKQQNIIGEGWQVQGNLGDFCIGLGGGAITDTEPHLITGKIGQQRSYYYPQPTLDQCITGGVLVLPNVVPLGGTGGSLTGAGWGNDYWMDQSSNDMFLFDANYNPTNVYDEQNYTLTSKEQNTFNFVNGTLTKARDPKGNGYDVTDNGDTITHTSGATFKFVRNGDKLIAAFVRPDGKQRTYAYNAAKELVGATDFDGRLVRFTYNAAHDLAEAYNPRGNRIFQATYDDQHRLLRMTQNGAGSSAGTTTYQYDLQNHATTTTLPSGDVEKAEFDDSGNETKHSFNGKVTKEIVKDGSGNVTQVTVDGKTYKTSFGQGSVVVDDGKTPVTMATDANGKITQVTTPTGSVSYQRDAQGRATSMTQGSHTTTVERDQSDQISSMSFDGQKFTLAHDANGYIKSATGLDGTTYTYVNDGMGRPTGVQFMKDGHLMSYEMSVDADGFPTQTRVVIDGEMLQQSDYPQAADGQPAQSDSGEQQLFNGAGQVAHVYYGTAAATSFEYTNGMRTGVITPEGSTTRMAFDKSQNAMVTDFNGLKSTTIFDTLGRVVGHVGRDGGTTSYQYDQNGNLTTVHFPDGSQASTTYDNQGRPSVATGRYGEVIHYGYDSSGNKTSEQHNGLPAMQFKYDATNRLVSTTTAAGLTVVATYDADGNVASTGAMGGPMPAQFTWTQSKQLTGWTDGNGNKRTITLGKAGREKVEKRASGSTQTTTMLAMGAVRRIEFDGTTTSETDDPKGRPLNRTGADGTMVSFTYDRDGQPATLTDAEGNLSISRALSGEPLIEMRSDGSFVRYAYDTGRPSALQTRGGTDQYAYAGGVLASIQSAAGPTIAVAYDATSKRPVSWSAGPVQVAYTLDGNQHLAEIKLTSGGNVVADQTITVDADGRTTSVSEKSGARAFAYDAAGRLTQDGDEKYAYDDAYNLTSVTSTSGSRQLAYSADNEATQNGAEKVTHNARGQLTSVHGGDRDVDFTWDGLGRLVKASLGGASGAHEVDYTYDARGLLVSRTEDGVRRNYTWAFVDHQAPQLVEESDANGTVLARTTWNGPIGVRKAGSTTYVLVEDQFLNVRWVFDDSGKLVDTRDITAYGELTGGKASVDVPFVFAGSVRDPVVGIDYMVQRWYDPKTAQFLSEDPAAVRANQPATLNRYQYGLRTPTVAYDPMGSQELVEELEVTAIDSELDTMQIQELNMVFKAVSSFIALSAGSFNFMYDGLFKFISDNHKTMWPSSLILGGQVGISGAGLGSFEGVEVLWHLWRPEMSGTFNGYFWYATPSALADAEAGLDKNDIVNQSKLENAAAWVGGGGAVGFNLLPGASKGVYYGYAWDVISPGAYAGPFATMSMWPVLMLPWLTLQAFASSALDGTSVTDNLQVVLSVSLVTLAHTLVNAFFQTAGATGMEVLGDVAKLRPDLFNAAGGLPVLALYGVFAEMQLLAGKGVASDLLKNLSKMWQENSMSLSWSPFASKSDYCDQNGQCDDAQAWGISFARYDGDMLKPFTEVYTAPSDAIPQVTYQFSNYLCVVGAGKGGGYGCKDTVTKGNLAKGL